MLTNLTVGEKLIAIIDSAGGFASELILAALFIILICADLLFKYSKHSFSLLTMVGFGLASINLISANTTHGNGNLFIGFLQTDGIASYFKLLFLLSGILTTLMLANEPDRAKKIRNGEFYALLTALILGLNLMVMAANLLAVYLSIELVSISSYLLAGWLLNDKSAESSLKYLLFGAVASGIMLFGMSLLYGFSGTLDILSPAFAANLAVTHPFPLTVAALLTLAGLLFKIAAVPFHIWAPDVYEAAPTPVVAFFSIAPKAAGLAVFIHLLYNLNLDQSQNLVALIGMATILVGNLSALWQKNTKRMLAYSSIAHAGFMLAGVAALSSTGLTAILFYLTVYLFTNFGIFLLVQFAEQHGQQRINDFKGWGAHEPLFAILMLIAVITLTGLPPTAGFTAKLFVFSALWENYQSSQNPMVLWLFVIGLVNTAISLFYYLKIPFYMFFRNGAATNNIALENKTPGLFLTKTLALCLILPLIIFFFKADWLMDWIESTINKY